MRKLRSAKGLDVGAGMFFELGRGFRYYSAIHSALGSTECILDITLFSAVRSMSRVISPLLEPAAKRVDSDVAVKFASMIFLRRLRKIDYSNA